MRAFVALSIIAAAGVAAWGIARRRDLASSAPASPAEPASWTAPPAEADPLTSIVYAVEDLVTDWKAKGAKYAPIIAAAAIRNSVSPDLLMRVAYQECRWREDIITGKTRSSAGAVGMFQFMPGTSRELGVDPLNVTSAADGAARYLRQLYRQFGSWSWAVAAYNGGPGNISYFMKHNAWPKRNAAGQVIGTKARPTENVNYVVQIGADVSLA